MRTFLYKLTSDRGGAPCAPPPQHAGETPLLTLSICKPVIRQTAQEGDQVLGITSHALAASDGYPLLAVIYAARVTGVLGAGEYYAEESPFLWRPDCIYSFHQAMGRETLAHSGRTRLHDDPRYEDRDIGRYPFYKKARTLLSSDFRYFGARAVPIPARLALLRTIAETLGQGHRVFKDGTPEAEEADSLFKSLWRRKTGYTPADVQEEARGHRPQPGPARPPACPPDGQPAGRAARRAARHSGRTCLP